MELDLKSDSLLALLHKTIPAPKLFSKLRGRYWKLELSLKKPFPRQLAGTSLKKGRSSRFENLHVGGTVLYSDVYNRILDWDKHQV